MEALDFTGEESFQHLLAHLINIKNCSSLKIFYQNILFSFTIWVIKYLAQFYCVCIVSNALDTNQVTDINLNWNSVEADLPLLIWLKYDALRYDNNQTNVDDLVRIGIDNGCQVKIADLIGVVLDSSDLKNWNFFLKKAFITSPNATIDFLNGFENVRYTAKNRYHLVHVVALPSNHWQSNEYVGRILNHPTVRGKYSVDTL